MAAKLTRLRPATIKIDGQPVRINISRLQLEEASAHRTLVRGLLNRPKSVADEPIGAEDAAAVRHAIETYISVPRGELSVDDEPITTGAQLMELIGEDPAALMRALLAIMGVSSPTADEGKPSASASASVPPSDAPHLAPVGLRPVQTADAAAPADSTEIEAVTEATEQPSSGPTAILN